MQDIGRICVKIAGRDAGKKCVIVDVIDNNYVLIDGATRRRKCNISHLEPTEKVLKIAKAAKHEEIVKVFEAEKLTVSKETTKKTPAPRFKKQHINRKKESN